MGSIDGRTKIDTTNATMRRKEEDGVHEDFDGDGNNDHRREEQGQKRVGSAPSGEALDEAKSDGDMAARQRSVLLLLPDKVFVSFTTGHRRGWRGKSAWRKWGGKKAHFVRFIPWGHALIASRDC